MLRTVEICLKQFIRVCWGLAAISSSVPAISDEGTEKSRVSSAPIIVSIDAFQFQPDIIRIKRGQSVLIINKDEVPHTVTPDKGASFVPSGIIKGGEQKEIFFESAGTHDYSCDFHPSMRGQVVVQ